MQYTHVELRRNDRCYPLVIVYPSCEVCVFFFDQLKENLTILGEGIEELVQILWAWIRLSTYPTRQGKRIHAQFSNDTLSLLGVLNNLTK